MEEDNKREALHSTERMTSPSEITKDRNILVSTARPNSKSDNRIANTKCSFFGFPWMIMKMQVENVSSIFFLFIMLLQMNPKFQITSPYSSVLPWSIILLVNVVKEAADYSSRYRRDKEINMAKYKKITRNEFMQVQSQHIKVGEIILIEKDQRVPADCILLKTEDPSGEVFIRTDQLDGETDWKRRTAALETQQCSLGSLGSIEATIEMPSKDIYKFKGRLKIGRFLERREDNVIVFGRPMTPRGSPPTSTGSVGESTAGSTSSGSVGEGMSGTPGSIQAADQKLAGSITSSQNAPGSIPAEKATSTITGSSSTSTLPSTSSSILLNARFLGCDLDNTLWCNTVVTSGSALALVIYTGLDTRSMMNTNSPRNKIGTFDKELDVFVALMAGISLISAFLFSFLRAGLEFSESARIVCIRYVIIFSYVIPISLKFMLATARFIYVWLLSKDDSLKTVKVLTNTLQEELARISFFLTDKTGTLTKNEMVMRKLHIGTVCYNAESRSEISRSIAAVLAASSHPRAPASILSNASNSHPLAPSSNLSNVANSHPLASSSNADALAANSHPLVSSSILSNVANSQPQTPSRSHFWKKTRGVDQKVFDLVEALSVSHCVIPIATEGGLIYQAASPDEVAMVNYSALVGLTLVERDTSRLVIEDHLHNRIVYEILHTFTFTSETKRMGIILRKDGQYILFVKGADTVMKGIVKENDWIDEEIDNMAREGLRTLVVARRLLTAGEYEAFAEGHRAAKMSMGDRTRLMLQQQCLLERSLDVVGLTGVEDRLQDNVKQTLESLRNAGIRVWMLTGDKIETAISIAFSSRLLNKTDQYLVISSCTTREEVEAGLRLLETRAYNSLIIDGASIAIVIDHALVKFIEIAKGLHCLIGCRYTPTQKAVMASALRRLGGEKVLCIGDGGNDVSMITQADVGVGIEGKEGSQASLAADFALKNFSEVAELMFHHGRRCYRNSSKMAHLIFHRGILISTIQAIFCCLIRFYPISILQGKMPALFILFTIIPLFSIIIDSDIPKGLAMQFPELFKELQINNPMSMRQFFISLTMSIFQAAVFILLNFHFMRREMFSLSVISFTNLVINEQLMVLLSLFENINAKVVGVCLGSLTVYIASIPLFSELRNYNEVSQMGLFLMVMNIVAIFPKFCLTIYSMYLNPSSHIKLLRHRQL